MSGVSIFLEVMRLRLKEKVSNIYLEQAHRRWMVDINDDCTDIMAEMGKAQRREVEKEKRNVLATLFLSIYDFKSEELQRDLTKLIMLDLAEVDNIPMEERRKLLRVLWESAKILMGDGNYSALLNEIERIVSFNRKYFEDWDLP